jgi:hypothetical protein
MSITKEIEPKTILGHKYTGTYIPASEACLIAFKLASFLSGSNMNIEELIGQNDNNLILKILSRTLRDGVAINKAGFDSTYTANLMELIEALKFVIEVNFGDFLQVSGIGSLNEQLNKVTSKTAAL